MPGSSLGTTLSGSRRDLRPKLLATCRRHLLSTAMMPLANGQCLVFYSSNCFLMLWLPELSSSTHPLSISFPFPSPLQSPFPFPFSFPFPSPLASSFTSPLPSSLPSCVRSLAPVRPFLSFGHGYPLGIMRVRAQTQCLTNRAVGYPQAPLPV